MPFVSSRAIACWRRSATRVLAAKRAARRAVAAAGAASQAPLQPIRWGILGWPRVGEVGWPPGYNHVRPHSSLKDMTPIEFKARYDSVNQEAVPQL